MERGLIVEVVDYCCAEVHQKAGGPTVHTIINTSTCITEGYLHGNEVKLVKLSVEMFLNFSVQTESEHTV